MKFTEFDKTTKRNADKKKKKIKDSVWAKGDKIHGKDPKVYRKDKLGNTIKYDLYGKQKPQGWEIDHIIPTAKGGKDTLKNKQPLQWEANRRKGTSNDTFNWIRELIIKAFKD